MEPTIRAYIAGFLDGDGSVFFQLVRKPDYRFGFQIRASIAFYQKTTNERILDWLKEHLRSGSIRRRATGMSDYTIVGVDEVGRVLRDLQCYVVLKREHVRLGLEILESLTSTIGPRTFVTLCRQVDRFRDLNYSKKRTVTSEVVERHLQLAGLLESSSGEVAEPLTPERACSERQTPSAERAGVRAVNC